MTDPITLWHEDGAAHGWVMPRVPSWWRWWGVRHVRWWWLGQVPWPSRYLMWRRFGIWHGLELKQDEPGGGE